MAGNRAIKNQLHPHHRIWSNEWDFMMGKYKHIPWNKQVQYEISGPDPVHFFEAPEIPSLYVPTTQEPHHSQHEKLKKYVRNVTLPMANLLVDNAEVTVKIQQLKQEKRDIEYKKYKEQEAKMDAARKGNPYILQLTHQHNSQRGRPKE